MAPSRQDARRKAMRSGGVVVPFPGADQSHRDYNGRTMRPATAPAPRPTGAFRLGQWTVRPERNLLESRDESRHLEPKAMDALVLLATRSEAVVSKDEFIDEVWEGRIISEGTLTNTIAELRSALGDDARSPRYIETIPKRGYRLVCAVERVPADEAPDADEVGASPNRRWIVPFAVLAIALSASVAVILSSRPRTLDPGTVLVVPFANRTGDPSLDPLTTLARDRIVGQLSGSGIARPRPLDDRAASNSLDEICGLAREQGTALALSGALYLHEGEVEVQAQLVDAAEGALLYAVPVVSGPRERTAELLEDSVQRILGALATHLFTHAHSSLQSRPPAFEAYREFLAGSELFPGDMRGAIRHLSRAVEIDPEFTSARIRLAMVLLNARRADEGCAILEDLRVRRAELTEFERLWLDRALARYEGRSEDSLAALHSIRRLSPADWTTMYLVALEELRLNRPRRAVAALEELHAADLPDFVTRHGLFINSYRLLANAWHIVGDHESELAATQAGRARSPTDHNLMVVEAKARAALGDSQGLEAVIAEAESTPMSLTPANLLVEAAASARAHDRPEFSRTLAEQAIALLRRSAGAAAERLLLAEASVLLGELDRAQTIFEALVAELTPPRNYLDLIARGWLGSVAARRGDLVTAQSIDRELAGIDDPYLYGWPVYYRASVAAWLGHRDEAIALLRTARAAGWSASFALHDGERVLFEPLEGMAEYEEMLHPVE